jgi:hypothetical protein
MHTSYPSFAQNAAPVRLLVPCLMVALLCPSVAAAQTTKAALESQAHKDCLIGKVDAGVSQLADLFAQTGDPNCIFNQGRCYQQNARPTEAINSFREYLRLAKDIGDDVKAVVQNHINECRAMQAEQAKMSSVSRPGGGPAGPLDLGTGSRPEGDAPAPRPFYTRWWFWGGAAAVVVGTVAAVLIVRGRSSDPCHGEITCRSVN